MTQEPLTYAGSGVDYDSMDPFKRQAQRLGRETALNISRLNGGEFVELEMSRGESCYLIEAAKSYFGHVEEGLGTKNLVADAMYARTGRSYYDHIAQDTVAMIVNDMATAGAVPLSIAMHLAVGDSDWFKDERRATDLLEGWKRACDLSGAIWGGGETPTLKDVVYPNAVVLSGSAFGIVKPKERLIKSRIRDGDSIIAVESSGIHANGLTLARKIADRLPDGYLTTMNDGRSYGDALLDPTIIYVRMVEKCLDAGIDIHYAVNVTGHGWRKLMRANEPFSYEIENLAHVPQVFRFIQQHAAMTDRAMYETFNMGVGFVLYVPVEQADAALMLINRAGVPSPWRAYEAGRIRTNDRKQVVIKPLGITFDAETLQVR